VPNACGQNQQKGRLTVQSPYVLDGIICLLTCIGPNQEFTNKLKFCSYLGGEVKIHRVMGNSHRQTVSAGIWIKKLEISAIKIATYIFIEKIMLSQFSPLLLYIYFFFKLLTSVDFLF
jgi:hypothetical protein